MRSSNLHLHLGPRNIDFRLDVFWRRRGVRLCVRYIYLFIADRETLCAIFIVDSTCFGVGAASDFALRQTFLFLSDLETFARIFDFGLGAFDVGVARNLAFISGRERYAHLVFLGRVFAIDMASDFALLWRQNAPLHLGSRVLCTF
jgi:hypothetical protein